MTNPDREELVKLADRLAFLSNVGFGYDIIDTDRSILRKSATALRRLASSDGGAKGEPEPVAWRDDPTSDERWNAGCDFAMTQLCKALDVDPAAVNWDAAAETVDGDVQSVIWNILRTRMGEDWDPATVPSSDAGMREALEEIEALCRHLRQGGPDPMDLQELSDALEEATNLASGALTAPGATTKSDVEALAATTAERHGTVTSEPEPSTSDSARDDVPLGYERVTDGTTLPGDKFRYALDNNGVTGKVIGHFRPIKPGPSDPSSTRSEVTVEFGELVDDLLTVVAEVRRQNWKNGGAHDYDDEDASRKVARALLDQFEIRRK